jgi:hypothetical protein
VNREAGSPHLLGGGSSLSQLKFLLFIFSSKFLKLVGEENNKKSIAKHTHIWYNKKKRGVFSNE